MKIRLLIILLGLCSLPAAAQGKPPPLGNPALLNIGFVCRWEARCMKQQSRAMDRALRYVKSKRTPPWKIQLCNRNASRRSTRVDWIGFGNCIRNRALRMRRR